MPDSAAGENQGVPYSDERLKLEQVLRDELAHLRRGLNDERSQAPPRPNALSRLRAHVSSVWTAFRGKKSRESWTRKDECVPASLAKKFFKANLTALCLSGGGIRSASFCLGILQALARQKLLSQFDYNAAPWTDVLRHLGGHRHDLSQFGTQLDAFSALIVFARLASEGHRTGL